MKEAPHTLPLYKVILSWNAMGVDYLGTQRVTAQGAIKPENMLTQEIDQGQSLEPNPVERKKVEVLPKPRKRLPGRRWKNQHWDLPK